MDSRSSNVLLTIPEFAGVNTNAPRGTKMQPELLENVNLDRTGGYSPMYERSARYSGVRAALSAGLGAGLFLTGADGTSYSSSLNKVLWPGSAADTTRLMPGLLLSSDGKTYVLTDQALPALAEPPPLVSGILPPVRGVSWAFGNDNAKTGIPKDLVLEWLLVFQRGGTHSLITKAQDSEYYALVLSGSDPGPVTIYRRVYNADPAMVQDWVFLAQWSGEGVIWLGMAPSSDTIAELPSTVEPQAADYHQGRVFVSGALVSLKISRTVTAIADRQDNRLYFSRVIAKPGRDALPVFSPSQYLDVPFRVSSRIGAVVSCGPYLYIFGDRELWVMTGDPDSDARLECIGDSIGTLTKGSVQQLSGAVYWLSDSGLLRMQGGQVQEVGEPVRDQLLSLGSNISSTVDFRREQYLITDGATILVYHARENGWTTRKIEGSGRPALLYGAGTPYMLQGEMLYSIGGERNLTRAPDRLTMHIRWPYFELGDWRVRKTFLGVAFGLDLATTSATVQHRSTVDARLDQTADTSQTVQAGTAGAVRLHTTQDGMPMSGCALSIEVKVSTQDSRGILRPPLMVYGHAKGEETWTDER